MELLTASLSSYSFRLVDILFVAVVIYGAYRGFFKGLIVEVISLFTFMLFGFLIMKLIVLGFTTAGLNSSKLLPFLVLAFMLFGLSVLLVLLGRFLSGLISFTLFGSLDALLGLVLGGFKYIFGLGLMLTLLNQVGLITESTEINQSLTYPIIMGFFQYIVEIIGVLAPSINTLLDDVRLLLKGS
ncbi:MAG: CvpA family protein [Bernardetiaceae bacterium]|nr:CvpA family protein [Bernardetiaceae bacterium]